MKPLLRKEADSQSEVKAQLSEYTKCKECGNQIKKTRHNRLFCNDSCRVKHHLKMKGKRVMLLSKEEYEVIMEMRRKDGE